MMKEQKGITLIALVITIIVLLILAGVSIAMLTGENGLLTQSQRAAAETLVGEAKDHASTEVAAAYATYAEEVYTNTTTPGQKADDFEGWLATHKINDPSGSGSDDGKYFEDIDSGTITLKPNSIHTDGKKYTVTGTIGEQGGITWDDSVVAAE